MENKKFTAGKWMGLLSFFYLLISIMVTKIIILTKFDTNIEYLYKIDLLSYGQFVIVWGAVFGSGAIKKWRKKE